MAKPRKQKNTEDQKGSTSNASAAISPAVVLHQKLCLSIDMEHRRIYGHTELKVVVPKSGVVGLYANCMNIDNVLLNGLPVRFKCYSQHQQFEIEKNRGSRITCNKAADAAGSLYFSSLEREVAPDLLIFCGKATSAESAVQDPADTENVSQTISTECKPDDANRNAQQENVKLVRIEYWLEKPEVGVHFMDSTLHTNSQLRRARCWFPCIDSGLQRCCYDLEFTVDSKYVAVSNGTLLYQLLYRCS